MKKKLISLSMAMIFCAVSAISVFADDNMADISADENEGIMLINETHNDMYIPVRETFEALGFEVEWHAETKMIALVNLPQYVTFTIGIDGYTIAKTAPQPLGAAPIIEDERAYVPISLLEFMGIDLNENEEESFEEEDLDNAADVNESQENAEEIDSADESEENAEEMDSADELEENAEEGDLPDDNEYEDSDDINSDSNEIDENNKEEESGEDNSEEDNSEDSSDNANDDNSEESSDE